MSNQNPKKHNTQYYCLSLMYYILYLSNADDNSSINYFYLYYMLVFNTR